MSKAETKTHGYTAGKDALVKRLHLIRGVCEGSRRWSTTTAPASTS